MKRLSLLLLSLATVAQQAFAGDDYCTYDCYQSVPEASTLGMLALGIGAVAAVRYLKK